MSVGGGQTGYGGPSKATNTVSSSPTHADCSFEPKSGIDQFANILAGTTVPARIRKYTIDMLDNAITMGLIYDEHTDDFIKNITNYAFVIKQFDTKTILSVDVLTSYQISMAMHDIHECNIEFIFSNITVDNDGKL